MMEILDQLYRFYVASGDVEKLAMVVVAGIVILATVYGIIKYFRQTLIVILLCIVVLLVINKVNPEFYADILRVSEEAIETMK